SESQARNGFDGRLTLTTWCESLPSVEERLALLPGAIGTAVSPAAAEASGVERAAVAQASHGGSGKPGSAHDKEVQLQRSGGSGAFLRRRMRNPENPGKDARGLPGGLETTGAARSAAKSAPCVRGSRHR